MTFCKKCVMPDTRPDLSLDKAGVCNACQSTAAKAAVDWRARADSWFKLCEQAKQYGSDYDCIAAVSGGKDSHYIVWKCLEAGLKPLCVSFEPSMATPIGERNLANLQHFADLVQLRKNRVVYNKLRLYALRTVGDSEWPNHVGIFSSVWQEAMRRRIGLIVWGESPQAEYAPPDARSRDAASLDRAWLEEFGGLLGLRVRDFVDFGFSARDLAPYRWPAGTDQEIRSVFLGQFFRWDTIAQTRLVTERMGFESRFCGWPIANSPYPPHGAYWHFENLDDTLAVEWHDYFALLKYGYTRAAAQLSIEIRHGYKSRNEALEIVAKVPNTMPADAEFCAQLELAPTELKSICDSFINKAIWEGDSWNLERRLALK